MRRDRGYFITRNPRRSAKNSNGETADLQSASQAEVACETRDLVGRKCFSKNDNTLNHHILFSF